MSPTDILCPQCQTPNPPGASICGACGTELSIARSPITSGIVTLSVNEVLQNGRYVIEGFLGRGGMGAVYRVRDTRLEDKRWAIKEMSAFGLATPEEIREGVKAFRREAAMLAHLSHRNLPKVIDNFEENGRQYLVMDLVEGQTLSSYLLSNRGQPLPVDQVLDWAMQVCDALSYLHRQQPPIIFRDVKPDNIMVDKEGVVKLIDFGIARHFKTGKIKDTVDLGTPGYAPPEQWGKQQSDPRSDVYALAATLHHMLTARDPTQHSSFVFPPARQLNPAVPDGLSAALQKALSVNPDDRWATVDEFRQAISTSHQPTYRPARSYPSARISPSSPAPISSTDGNRSSSGCAPFARLVDFGRNGVRGGRSLAFWIIRILLRPIVWLLPFPGIIRGVAVAALILGFMLMVFNGVIRVPTLTPIWNWLSSRAGELVLLGSIAQVTGISIVLILQILLSILLLPLGGLLGHFAGSEPKIKPPSRYRVQKPIGRENNLEECRNIWNGITNRKDKEPTFVALRGKPGVGKTTVLMYFFLEKEEEIEQGKLRVIPYRYLLWIDCADDKPGAKQLVSKLPWPLRAYYAAEVRMDVLAESCARFLQNVDVAIFIDHLDVTGTHEALGFWEPFLRSMAKRRLSRLSVWITAAEADDRFFHDLGQLRPRDIWIDPLLEDDVVKIISRLTNKEPDRLQLVEAHCKQGYYDIKQLTRDAVSAENLVDSTKR